MESRVFQAKGKACTKSCVRRELRFLGNCKKATKARMQTGESARRWGWRNWAEIRLRKDLWTTLKILVNW